MVCVPTKYIPQYSAKDILNKRLQEFNGRGGGKDNFAQGGATLPS